METGGNILKPSGVWGINLKCRVQTGKQNAMSKKKASLTWQLVFTMVGIVAGTMVLCWFFNGTFLEKYYIYEKEQELLVNYNKVTKAFSGTDGITMEMEVTFEKICAESNINMLITDDNRMQLWTSYSSAQRFQMQMDNWLYGTDREKSQVLVSGDTYILVRQTDERLNSEYLVLLGSIPDGGSVYMRTALESIRESAAVTNRFFSILSLCAVMVSIIMIIILSRNISHPIRALSGISQRMAKLDFDVHYEPGRRVSREIDELGISVNELSSVLEHTISELKSANANLQQDIKKKEQIDEMRKEFLANVSHELKTPLALIQGYAEGLKECVSDDPESREFYCDVIMDEAEKMNRMVRQLLTLNQLESGNHVVEMTRFDITELIEGVIISASLMAAQKQVEIIFKKEKAVYVWGDEFQVEEVITNFLTNAMNHADGKRQVIISFSRHDNLVRTSVFNTGMQIPEEELDKIWGKFYKVDKARTREYGGSGIGLSIVRAVMDSFNRECGVINHPDGVEFWMELESNN